MLIHKYMCTNNNGNVPTKRTQKKRRKYEIIENKIFSYYRLTGCLDARITEATLTRYSLKKEENRTFKF